jgi:hypothetical protein
MGEKVMFKNIIIIALVIFVYQNSSMSGEDFINYLQTTLDNLQELLYNMKEKVK